MNEIFLWFWLADIMGAIGVIGVFCLMAVIVVAIVGSVIWWEYDGEEKGKRVLKLIYWLLIPVSVAVIAPDKNTIRLYALTKAGQIATTETEIGKKSVQALEAILDEIIEKKKK